MKLDSKLYLGDCLPLLQKLPDHSVDLLLTDPPYGINYLSRSTTLPLVRILNDGVEAYKLLDDALRIIYDKLKPNAHVYIFTTWQAYEPMAAIVRKYFNLKNVLVWEKNNRTRGDLKGNYGYAHEMVLYAHKGRRYLLGKRDDNILRFKKVPSQHMRHPTEKPVELLKYIIQKSSALGEVVLDPFAGVGSVGVAALETGRKCILIEIEEAWAQVAALRTGLAYD